MAAPFPVALICLWKLQRRRGLDRAARVIYEVPHEDSEVDGTSTSSSKGSSQWCQVPVYESFDYFERVGKARAVMKESNRVDRAARVIYEVPHEDSEVDGTQHQLVQKGPPMAVRYDREGCGSALSPVNNGACGCATLTLPNLTRNHAGRYVCEVTMERPMFIQFGRSGTMITVWERRSPTNGTTQKEETRLGLDRAARVIYVVPHEDSEVDGTSTSSSKGSSQWCQVPVYESFDYFECVVESKGGG
ncbi:unnamed protein product [Gadus morhua 'NCC']